VIVYKSERATMLSTLISFMSIDILLWVLPAMIVLLRARKKITISVCLLHEQLIFCPCNHDECNDD